MLIGFVHEDPLRFLSIEEICDTIADLLDAGLTRAQTASFQLDSEWWQQLRARNSSSLYPCTVKFVAFEVKARSELAADRKKARLEGVKAGLEQSRLVVTRAVMAMQPRLGRTLTADLYSWCTFGEEKAAGVKRSWRRVCGVAWRPFVYRATSYRESLAQLGATEFETYALPGSCPSMIIGKDAFLRDRIVTVYGVPFAMTLPDVLVALQVEGGANLSDCVGVLSRFHMERKCVSWRIVLPSVDCAADVMSHKSLLLFGGSEVHLRKYYHIHDADTDWRGRGANVLQLLKYLRSFDNLLGPRCLAIQLWEDGFRGSCVHAVCGEVRLLGRTFTPMAQLYVFRGSDAESAVTGVSVSLLASCAERGKQIGAFVLMHDHAMSFQRTGVRAGNVGFRNTFVLLEADAQGVLFYARERTVWSLASDARALCTIFDKLAVLCEELSDVTTTTLSRLLRAAKRTVSHGVVDLISVLQFTVADLWGNPDRLRALQLWQRAYKFAPTSWDLKGKVVLNMRVLHSLEGDGHLSLAGLISPGAQFEMCDEQSQPIVFDGLRSRLPVREGARLFLHHNHLVDLNAIVLMPPILHCAIYFCGIVTQELDSTMVAGGLVLGVSTLGFSSADLQKLTGEIRQMLLGKAFAVHSYAELSGQTPIFDTVLRVLGNVTHPGIAHLVPLMRCFLRTRSSNDLSLKEEGSRYSRYVLAFILCPCIVAGELTELRGRRGLAGGVFSSYLKVRSWTRQQDVSRDAIYSGEGLSVASLDESAFAGEGETQEETGVDVSQKQRVDAKKRKFDSCKVASLLCGVPRAIFRLNQLTNEHHLFSHCDEGLFERSFKGFKAGIRDSNQRHHVMQAGSVAHNAAVASSCASAAHKSHTWDGEGISYIVVCMCWLVRLRVAGHNFVEALRLCEEGGIDLRLFLFCMRARDRTIDVVAIRLGKSGEMVHLCACGDPQHRNSVSAWEKMDSAALQELFRLQPPAVKPQHEAPESVESVWTVIEAEVKRRAERRKNATEKEVREEAVTQKLEQLGFDVSQGLRASVLREFYTSQPAYLFTNRPWPKRLAEQIEFVFEHQDDDFEHNGYLESMKL